MSTDPRNHEYNRMMDAARARAQTLRREAITQFWHDAGLLADEGLRSAHRLAARLMRRAPQHTVSLGGRPCTH